MSKHHIIYIPGIGDTKTTLQELATKTWLLWGVMPHTFPMRWADKEAFTPKFERLLTYIDTLLAQGDKVSLVGASAGASVVLNAFAARKDHITGVICISGKIHHPEAIGEWYRTKTPAFVESANQAQESLKSLDHQHRSRILSRYSPVDIVVLKKDSIIQGATNQAVFSLGHAPTIATQLVFGAPSWIRFLKSLQQR